jgi:serine/threonine protein kinase/tetratricopeptide (TPR) repeat protein
MEGPSSPSDQAALIFNQARRLAKVARETYLREACKNDSELRRLIDDLLVAHAKQGEFLAEPTHAGPPEAAEKRGAADHAGEAMTELPASSLNAPESKLIGRYKLLQHIGEGGFGEVWMAEQREPIKRRVALKIIKLGMDTRGVIARFEAERQALAMMDHPNITRVLDCGATDAQSPLGSGRPYFVMELVRGVPITQFCDDNRLAVRERLALFADVCHAVQHAHQKGVIHRDLKPSNVLVSRHDEKPVVKVIDFGIAKAISGRLTDKTLFTELRQLIGTPAYMSPEQAGLSDLDIDTRSDIYSLGVLLYELLTGTTPFDAERLRNVDFDELRRIIREEEPPKPSTRITSDLRIERRSEPVTPVTGSSEDRPSDSEPRPPGRGPHSDSSAATIGAARHTDPRSLARLLCGDLDWITMKCLEKDRQRRYETANGLAADIQRHLAAEPVVAAPPGARYRLLKFVRRHRVGVTASALVSAALLVGLVGTTWGVYWALGEAEQARRAESRRGLEAARADREARVAIAERDKAERFVKFVQEVLQTAQPSVALGRDTTMLREMMDAAAKRIDGGELEGSPEAELELRMTIGVTYREIHEFDRALAILEPAEALARSLASPQLPDVLSRRADALLRVDRAPEAERLMQEAAEMYRRLYEGDHEKVAQSLCNLGVVATGLDDLSRAETLLTQALAMAQRVLLTDHPDLARIQRNLADVLVRRGRLMEAEPLIEQALEMNQRLHPDAHPDVASSLASLATLRTAQGRLSEAEPLLRRALEMKRRLFKDSEEVMSALFALTRVLEQLGRDSEVQESCRELLVLSERLHAGDHPSVAHSLIDLARARDANGLMDAETEQLFRSGLDMYARMGGSRPGGDRARALDLHHLANVLRAQGKLPEAESLARQAVAIYREHPDDWARSESPHADVVLYHILLARGRPQEAADALHDRLAAARRQPGEGGQIDLLDALVGCALLRIGTPDALAEAEALLHECVSIRERAYPDGHGKAWLRFSAMSMLGEALSRQGKFDAAEPLLLGGYNGLTKETSHILPVVISGTDHRRDALERIVTLYDAWHTAEPEDARVQERLAKWQGALAQETSARAPPGPGP